MSEVVSHILEPVANNASRWMEANSTPDVLSNIDKMDERIGEYEQIELAEVDKELDELSNQDDDEDGKLNDGVNQKAESGSYSGVMMVLSSGLVELTSLLRHGYNLLLSIVRVLVVNTIMDMVLERRMMLSS